MGKRDTFYERIEQIRASLPQKVSDMTVEQIVFVFQRYRSFFREYQLTGATLDQKNLHRITFDEILGQKTSFRGCNLSNCQVLGCDWSGANLSEANLEGILIHPNDKGIRCNLSHAWFISAQMERASLAKTNFVKASFSRADLTNAYIRDCDFQGADFTGAIMTGDEFVVQRVDMRGADLTSAQLEPSVFSEVIYDQYTRWPAGFNPQSIINYTCIYKPS